MVKPSARGFKPFREANNWVEHMEGFVVTLEAQNLTHLVDKGCTVVDPDLDMAQQKHLHKVFKDTLIHPKAKLLVKLHASTKDARAIWEQACKAHGNSIAMLMNGDAILGWLASVQLHLAKWTRTQGEHVPSVAPKATSSMKCAMILASVMIRPFACFRMSLVALPTLRMF